MRDILVAVFTKILSMSMIASYTIVIVMLLRVVLRKAPKIFSYSLWGIVLFRLLCPVSFSSEYSMFNVLTQNKSAIQNIEVEEQEEKHTLQENQSMIASNTKVNKQQVLPEKNTLVIQPEKYQMTRLSHLGTFIWLGGWLILCTFASITYFSLRKKVRLAVKVRENYFESDRVNSPFVLGLIKPRIYLPVGLREEEKNYILYHESIHIKQKDYLIKMLAFFAVCVHWFNPLVWFAFHMMSMDMEMACDEKVIKGLGNDIKKAYSYSLFKMAVKQRDFISLTPVAFAESNTKKRIKHVLGYKKPVFLVSVGLVILLGIVGFSLMANPVVNKEVISSHIEEQLQAQGEEKVKMATVWAKALQTRDGKPRYEMMGRVAKDKFIEAQKVRVASNEWNFNIGYSSPEIVSYDVSIEENEAFIIYYCTDSTQATYELKEKLVFGEEEGKLVVLDNKELPAEWERVFYYAPDAKTAIAVYQKALLEGDYMTLLSLDHQALFDENSQEKCDAVKMSEVKIVEQQIDQNRATYKLAVTISESQDSNIVAGQYDYNVALIKDNVGWYIQKLIIQ